MNFLPEKASGFAYGTAGIVLAVAVFKKLAQCHKLDAFPTAGASALLGSWGAGFKFLTNAAGVIQEGYEKYNSAPFKVADLSGWIVILSSREHLEELRRAPEDKLSFTGATRDRLNTRYTIGDEVYATPYHLVVVRSHLTRNIGSMHTEIKDEIVTAFDEILDLRDNEWKSVSVLNAMHTIVCRSTNRVFVGLPLCRNPDWIDLNIRYSINVFKIGFTIGLFPKFLRPFVASFFSSMTRDTMCGLKHVGPIIEERLRHLKNHTNEWTEKPNDLISWLIEEAKGSQLTVKALTTRVLLINFVTIHTIAMSLTHALFHLAANPQFVEPLREEVEVIVKEQGWSKAALGKMRKVDSFLRECQRMEGVFALSVGRKAMKDFAFSDGTFIPKGTVISVAAQCLHYDERFYESANEFKPFRFAGIEEEDEEGSKYQFVSTGIEYLPFGHGRNTCPGRFFAASVMKTMLARVVTTYDIKFENVAAHPRSLRFADFISPDPRAKVLFRKRVD